MGGTFCRRSLLPSSNFFFSETFWHDKVNINFWIVRIKCCCCYKTFRVDYWRQRKSCRRWHNGSLLVSVRHHGENILSPVWNSKSLSDLFRLLISVLIDPIKIRIERVATVKVSVFLIGGLIGVAFGAEQTSILA